MALYAFSKGKRYLGGGIIKVMPLNVTEVQLL